MDEDASAENSIPPEYEAYFSDKSWSSGTQKEMLRFLQHHDGRSIVVNTYRGRSRDARYRWRLALDHEEDPVFAMLQIIREGTSNGRAHLDVSEVATP